MPRAEISVSALSAISPPELRSIFPAFGPSAEMRAPASTVSVSLAFSVMTPAVWVTGEPGLLIGVGLMLAPVYAEPGIQFDTRSVLLSISGLFLGPWPTLMAVVMTAVARYWIGGAWIVGTLDVKGTQHFEARTRALALVTYRAGLTGDEPARMGLALHGRVVASLEVRSAMRGGRFRLRLHDESAATREAMSMPAFAAQ